MKNSNTSGLRRHLERKHQKNYESLFFSKKKKPNLEPTTNSAESQSLAARSLAMLSNKASSTVTTLTTMVSTI